MDSKGTVFRRKQGRDSREAQRSVSIMTWESGQNALLDGAIDTRPRHASPRSSISHLLEHCRQETGWPPRPPPICGVSKLISCCWETHETCLVINQVIQDVVIKWGACLISTRKNHPLSVNGHRGASAPHRPALPRGPHSDEPIVDGRVTGQAGRGSSRPGSGPPILQAVWLEKPFDAGHSGSLVKASNSKLLCLHAPALGI